MRKGLYEEGTVRKRDCTKKGLYKEGTVRKSYCAKKKKKIVQKEEQNERAKGTVQRRGNG